MSNFLEKKNRNEYVLYFSLLGGNVFLYGLNVKGRKWGHAESRTLIRDTSLTISFRSRASAASRLAGLEARARSTGAAPLLRSSWIMAFFACILSISLHDPPLEFSRPLRLFGSGGRPSIQAGAPLAAPFADFPFMVHSRHRINKITTTTIIKLVYDTLTKRCARTWTT